jgi:hypothetical protein
MKDKEVNLEDTESSNTLGGTIKSRNTGTEKVRVRPRHQIHVDVSISPVEP